VEMIAGDGRDGLGGDAGIGFVGVSRRGGGFGGGSVGSYCGDFSDGAKEYHIVGLQAGTFSRRLLGTGASPQAGGNEKEQECSGQDWASNHEWISYLVTRGKIEDSCEIFWRGMVMALGSDAPF